MDKIFEVCKMLLTWLVGGISIIFFTVLTLSGFGIAGLGVAYTVMYFFADTTAVVEWLLLCVRLFVMAVVGCCLMLLLSWLVEQIDLDWRD